jgi:acetyltransferase
MIEQLDAKPPHFLENLFQPRSIAVVGAAASRNSGYDFIRHLQSFGFPGTVYAIHPDGKAVRGVPCYPNLTSVPGDIDYVIFAVPAHTVPDIMHECVEKHVKLAHLFTARLSETGVPELIKLERRIVEIASAGGIRILGSNGMGLYDPAHGMSFKANFPKEPGNVAFLSQSGGNTGEFVYRAGLRGIRFSKVISYGNACDLNEKDYLEYFLEDPATDIITAYLEGIRSLGQDFIATLKRVASRKPVVILKGGLTPAGARSTYSHTASLAGNPEIWKSLLHQTGVIQVETLEEMEDMVVGLAMLKGLSGSRVGMYAGGGGGMVAAADTFYRYGISLPDLSQGNIDELKELIPSTWMMMRNPVDVSAMGSIRAGIRLREMLFENANYDLVINDMSVDWAFDEERGVGAVYESIERLIDLQSSSGRLLAVIIRSADADEPWRQGAVNGVRQRFAERGIATFGTLGRAAWTVSKLRAYHGTDS